MKKELELLNDVFDYITGESKEFNSVQIIDKVVDIKLALYRLDKLETPPTSDDVCKALSEYYKTNVFCRKHEHQDVPAIGSTFIDTFYYLKIKTDVNGIEYKTERIIVLGDSVDVSLNASLPPHLITMIGRFYESESEKE